jgi:hypothetical protein
MKKYILILILSALGYSLQAATNYFFYLQLSDKHNSPYSLDHPEAYLSSRALARRASFNIVCDSSDLPVNPSYLQQIAALGFNIHSQSKWLNGVTVKLSDSSAISQVSSLAFVESTQYTGKMEGSNSILSKTKKLSSEDFIYGPAAAQINQLNGTALHNNGYTGRGIYVGVIDAGFNKADVNAGFDSLRLQERLLGTKDFAEPGSDVYTLDSHGANVLSIMAGNIANQYLGTAPKASYWLIRTEYAPAEYMMEVDFWVAGIEFADSVGIDIVNSSLGYTVFDDPTMNFTYDDMNGKVSRASIAANIATQKGIVVCNSAGNDGNKTWKYIGSPADAESVFAIGASTNSGEPSYFTSYGPSSDLRVKPEISAIGTATSYVSTTGSTVTGNGTSYSSPVLTGLLACYLQYCKSTSTQLSIETIRQSVIESSSLYLSPTDQLGYGFPDFQTAMSNYVRYSGLGNTLLDEDVFIQTFANHRIKIHLPSSSFNQNMVINITDLTGKLIFAEDFATSYAEISTLVFPKGVYLVSVVSNQNRITKKLVVR